ncbi:hypothetical protein [Paenibacillus sp. XY044]|uniref:hypothetical protein n=1 Tax=Paenibacillus sp. XY044 TaxID=2026089 RepID=UPI000B99A7D6|nr:hypothetical protein [Paenibacillus sp. XY044]OZB98065.1 hypothetical protein CJP46_02545 [Paenibacillus sp. XY044]
MDTYDIVVNKQVVESIPQQGRCREAMSFIIMDRVYKLTSEFKTYVEVYSRKTGGVYRYV